MKRINNLYEKIISIENLQLADQKARKGKTKSYGVKLHDKNREQNILKLHLQLKNKTYKTSKYDIFTIYEPKERLIYRLPYYPDRIVHHAIMNILEPIWVKIFTFNTYSCIKQRGIMGCANRVKKIISKYKNKPLFCLKIDITKFYPSIDHTIMKRIIRKKIKDKNTLWLLDEIIDSAEGLPIGNYLSQFLANLYLAYFMHFLNEKSHFILKRKKPFDIVEYADDIVILSDNKLDLHKLLPIIFQCLSILKLQVKPNYLIFPISKNSIDKHGRALDYIGYKFYKELTLLRKSIKLNFCRKIIKVNKQSLDFKNYLQNICPWIGWIKYSNSFNLLNNLINKMYDNLLRHKTSRIIKNLT